MADNFLSYNRFTRLPPNIADFGTSAEEVRLQRGSPDKNPVVSPMAAPDASERQLALAPRGSDQGRLGRPQAPEADPSVGPEPALRLLSGAIAKIDGEILPALLTQLGEQNPVAANLREPMRQSCRRVAAMARQLEKVHGWGRSVQARVAAVQRN